MLARDAEDSTPVIHSENETEPISIAAPKLARGGCRRPGPGGWKKGHAAVWQDWLLLDPSQWGGRDAISQLQGENNGWAAHAVSWMPPEAPRNLSRFRGQTRRPFKLARDRRPSEFTAFYLANDTEVFMSATSRFFFHCSKGGLTIDQSSPLPVRDRDRDDS